ncbi:condensation domain-containing protein, partial [Flavitalea flava]
MSSRELIRAVKQTTLDGYEHQEVPFEKVVEVVGVKREGGRNPLFGVMFVLENTPEPGPVELGGLGWETENFGQLTSKFELTLSIGQTGRGLDLGLTYRSGLYSRSRMERLLDHYGQLLASVVASPDEAIGRLELLGAGEKDRLVEGYGRSRQWYPRDKTVVELFTEQASRTPSAVAVVYEEQRLDYGELEARAEALAGYLRGQGVEVGSLVG